MSRILNIIIALITVLIIFGSINSRARNLDQLVIFAEQDMAKAMTSIAKYYSARFDTVVSIHFGEPADLTKRIQEGEMADVFISGHPDWIESLKRKGLIDVSSITNIAKNKMVLIAPESFTYEIEDDDSKKISPKQLIKDIKSVMGVYSVPIIVSSGDNSLGRYSEELSYKFFINNVSIYPKLMEDKNSIIELVEKNEIFGITFLSNITKFDKVKKIYEFDYSQSGEIFYEIASIAGENMQKARSFIKFIKTKEVQDIFAENGFMRIDNEEEES